MVYNGEITRCASHLQSALGAQFGLHLRSAPAVGTYGGLLRLLPIDTQCSQKRVRSHSTGQPCQGTGLDLGKE